MEQQAPTMYLLVNHGLSEVAHALYKIELPLDLSDYDQMIDSDGFMTDSKNISPVVTFKEPDLMPACASVTLGSKIYFFGGIHNHVKDARRHRKVQFFDTEHPELGMQTVSPLNVPKMCPCVFVADGMIYALGAYLAPIWAERTPLLPGSKDHATVVGRRVFIGSPFLYVVFNLDDQDWEQLPPPKLGHRFYCASFFVQDSASLYHLHNPESCKKPVLVLKKGPLALTTTEEKNKVANVTSLLNSPCLDFGKGQVVAEGTDLEDVLFARCNFNPYRNLLHMGDLFFCYVASAQLADFLDRTHYEPKSRGVWINFFEARDGNGEAKFRTFSFFCYKIDTDFSNRAISICCSILGTVPDSWIKAPLEKKLVIKLKPKSRRKTLDKAEQRHHELENAENREEAKDDKKLITLEEENRRLVAEWENSKSL